jgi:hypothetical protein
MYLVVDLMIKLREAGRDVDRSYVVQSCRDSHGLCDYNISGLISNRK